MGALEVSLLKFYQWVVDTAPAESWPVRLFTYLATGPFRRAHLVVPTHPLQQNLLPEYAKNVLHTPSYLPEIGK